MFEILMGVALVVGASTAYWYLLPCNGQVNPLVKNSDMGSLITITIMTIVTVGIGLVIDGMH